jgi:hypothetical protein
LKLFGKSRVKEVGYQDSFEGTDLLVWVQIESDEIVSIEISKID